MPKVNLLKISCFALSLLSLTQCDFNENKSTYVKELKTKHDCLTKDWETRQISDFIAENNVWNKGSRINYSQCVFIEKDNTGINAGWAWDWNNGTNDVVAYPDIIFGKNPWFQKSTTQALPKKIADINSLEICLDADHVGHGKHNLAFQIWITNNESCEPKTVTKEIMIWLFNEGLRPAGSVIDTFLVDEHPVELWKNPRHGDPNGLVWTYLAIVYKSPIIKGIIPVSKFLQYLVSNQHISSDEYLSGINLGNEIINGNGKTILKQYEIICHPNH